MNPENFDQEQKRQSEEAGCYGLLGGFAFSVARLRKMAAEEASHSDQPFICPGCRSDAVLRKCCEKADHFAHHARTSPVAAPESPLHRECLREIRDALKARFPNGLWEVNRPIPRNDSLAVERVVPDISGNFGVKGQGLVIEAQVSALSIIQIIKRSQIYTKREIPILWIVPLTEPIGEAPFRPRLYERYLHALHFGRVYYWQAGFGATAIPVHFGLAEREIPYSEWFDRDADEKREAGGYSKPYKVIRRPVLAQRVDLVNDFRSIRRQEFRPWNERKKVPSLGIWHDKLKPWWDPKEDAFIRNSFPEDNPSLIRARTKGKVV